MGTTFKRFSDGEVTVETSGDNPPKLADLKAAAAGEVKIVSGPAASNGAAWTPNP